MVRVTITPWRTQTDLLQVRQQLYQLDPDHDFARQYAVDRVMAWKQRGNLPHAIESTALLVDALLHHRNPSNSPFSIRAVYSAAFTRFVTGFCDIGRAKERTQVPLSMLDIARQIDMPDEFVTLRHEATHEELPNLQRLVVATEQGLQWLWNVYWSRLEEPMVTRPVEQSADDVENLRQEAKTVMRNYRKQRREAIQTNSHSSIKQEDQTELASRACLDLFGSSITKAETFMSVLIGEKLLVPSKRGLGSSLEGAFIMWDGLLQRLAVARPWFVAVFVKILLLSIDDQPNEESGQDASKEAFCLWLLRIVDGTKWTDVSLSDKREFQRQIVKWACTHPGHWTFHLAVQVMETSTENNLHEDWQTLLAASRLVNHAHSDLPDGSGVQGRQQTDEDEPSFEIAEEEPALPHEGELDTLLARLDDGQKTGSWSKVVTQPRCPIGVVAM